MIFISSHNDLGRFHEIYMALYRLSFPFVYEFLEDGTVDWYVDADDLYGETDLIEDLCIEVYVVSEDGSMDDIIYAKNL